MFSIWRNLCSSNWSCVESNKSIENGILLVQGISECAGPGWNELCNVNWHATKSQTWTSITTTCTTIYTRGLKLQTHRHHTNIRSFVQCLFAWKVSTTFWIISYVWRYRKAFLRIPEIPNAHRSILLLHNYSTQSSKSSMTMCASALCRCTKWKGVQFTVLYRRHTPARVIWRKCICIYHSLLRIVVAAYLP